MNQVSIAIPSQIPFGTREKEKIDQLPCERFLQGLKFSHAFLPSVSHGKNGGKFRKPVRIDHKADVLIFISL